MFSIWERNDFLNYDYIIIGAGIVGLNTGIQIKLKYPQRSVLVLERGWLATGASTKNAGFACMGSVGELLDDLKHSSIEEVIKLFEYRKKGLDTMRQLLGDKSIGYKKNGSHEVVMHDENRTADQIEMLNTFFRQVYNENVFEEKKQLVESMGFDTNKVHTLIKNKLEGEIDTGMMMRRLMSLAQELGVEIKTGIAVKSFHENDKNIDVIIENPISKEDVFLTCGNVVICTNAFANQFLINEDIQPGRGQVLITKPIKDLKLKGIFHKDKGYVYFREYKGCVLIGGGRHQDFESENTTQFGLNNYIQTYLENELRTYILPNQDFDIDLRWTGIMAFGKTKYPIVKKQSDRIYIAVRMGGMGVAIGSEVAKEVVGLMNN
jgi:glycine/D-amino acid oxidase-like deaminating enzyme